ncbi:MAG: alpha/beta fold hydrolase [Alphaproteobacteria bacterium]|nr:alpha/beta fold hydrolase [Alphaproteobacteria bacterium]
MVKVGGADIHVLEKGVGAPVLFLHGNPDTADMWSGVIDRLSDRFRCIALDLPGFGRSGAPSNFETSLGGLGRFVGDFVSAYGLEGPLDLVMHDFGGPFGLPWAIRNPERIRRKALTNTIFFSDYRWHPWARVWRTPVLGEISVALMIWPLFVHEMRRGSPNLSEAHLRATFRYITPQMKRMVLQLYRALDPANYASWEQELLSLTARVPTCVLWGDRDPYVAPRFADRYGARARFITSRHIAIGSRLKHPTRSPHACARSFLSHRVGFGVGFSAMRLQVDRAGLNVSVAL